MHVILTKTTTHNTDDYIEVDNRELLNAMYIFQQPIP